jgi:hypothetical protein
VRQLQQVRRLLIAGKSVSSIAALLSISRYGVNKLVEKLIEANMSRGRSRSKLVPYHQLISDAVRSGTSVRVIQEKLMAMNQTVHYTTVARYVRKIKPELREQVILPPPGAVAFVSLLKASRRRREANYLFCMMLGHSQYSFFAPVNELCLGRFLRTHLAAFSFFGGTPAAIQLCELPFPCLTKKYFDGYREFLDHYHIQLKMAVASTYSPCAGHIQMVRTVLLSRLFPENFKRFAQAVQLKYARPFNLYVHPVTKKPIRKEFLHAELPLLRPLPLQGFKLPTVAYRKTSGRGLVCFRYKHYKLPIQYKGQRIKVIAEERQLRFLCRGQEIACYPSQSQNQAE